MGRHILRLVHKRIAEAGETVARLAMIEGASEWRIKVYEAQYDSLIVQRPDSPDAVRLEARSIALADPPWREYCRWHSGPLDARDEPWTRIYCTVRAEGYCKQHRRSPRAVYEACMSLNGERALAACRLLDSLVRTEYVVYVTDGGSLKPKVGVTRRFRLLDRLAEQPHTVAAVVAVTDSAYAARRIEMSVSSRGIASERRPRRPSRSVRLAEAASLVARASEEAARLAGYDWDGRLVRVTSSVERIVRSTPEARPEKLYGVRASIAGYWGGYLVLHSHGRALVVSDRRLAHRDSLVAGEHP